MKPFHQEKSGRLYCGASEEVLQTFPNNCIDLVVTSPPYDDLRAYEALTPETFKAIAYQLYRVLKPGGVLVWVVADQTVDGDESGTSFRQALYFKQIRFKLHDTMIYRRFAANPPASNRYIQEFEYMFVFAKGAPKTANMIEDRPNKYTEDWGRNTKRQKDGKLEVRASRKDRPFGRRTNIWRIHAGSQDSKGVQHSAKFPDALATDHILSWSNPDDVVLDCFAGSGTTLKQARKNRRQWVGIEISETYCTEIVKDLKATAGLING